MPHRLPPNVKHAVGPPRREGEFFTVKCLCGWLWQSKVAVIAEDMGTKHLMEEDTSCAAD